VANYRQSVLTALQQVENNLAAQRILAQEAQQQAAVVQAGTAPYLNVITAQTTLTSARNAQLTLLNRRYAASVGLIQALGAAGGRTAARRSGPSRGRRGCGRHYAFAEFERCCHTAHCPNLLLKELCSRENTPCNT